MGKQPTLRPEVLRKAKPLRNPVVIAETADDGTVLLQAPAAILRRSPSRWFARATRLPQVRQFELEPVGAFVWRLCDGATTFDGISLRLRQEFKMSRQDADAALAAFLETLGHRRLIALAVPDKS